MTAEERMRRGRCVERDCIGTLQAILPVAAVFRDGQVIFEELDGEPETYAVTIECDMCGAEPPLTAGASFRLSFAEGGIAL